MNLIDLNLMPAMPEIVLFALLIAVLLADLWINDENRYLTHLMSLGTVIIVAVTQLAVWEQGSTLAFHGMYIADGMSRLSKLVLYGLTFGLFIYSKPYNQARGIFKGEFYTLSLFALLGMSVMVSAAHFLTAYIGLELLSLSLYAMIALRRDSGRSAEAALKYFVLGALASGLLLYGISMVYGATGSLEFATVLASSYSELANEWLLKLGLVFIVVAVAFKLGAVPFHMWVPDVYHGAPTSVAAFVGTAPKKGDIAETLATEAVFGFIPMSSQKSYLGHTLGACGALEAWFTIEMMNSGWFAPTVNLNDIDLRCGKVDYILSGGREIETDYVVSNNFAFGGVNTSLVFKRWQAY